MAVLLRNRNFIRGSNVPWPYLYLLSLTIRYYMRNQSPCEAHFLFLGRIFNENLLYIHPHHIQHKLKGWEDQDGQLSSLNIKYRVITYRRWTCIHYQICGLFHGSKYSPKEQGMIFERHISGPVFSSALVKQLN